MPSQKKRIGYLPSEKVRIIIDKIVEGNNYSQSKVTGILVEEALIARGFLQNNSSNCQKIDNILLNDYQLEDRIPLNKYSNKNTKINSRKENKLNEDLKFIDEFIEYKLFKEIMIQNKNNFLK